MAWHRIGDKLLSESVMVSLLAHICVTRPQCRLVFFSWLSKTLLASNSETGSWWDHYWYWWYLFIFVLHVFKSSLGKTFLMKNLSRYTTFSIHMFLWTNRYNFVLHVEENLHDYVASLEKHTVSHESSVVGFYIMKEIILLSPITTKLGSYFI